jgi:prepilin-type N-terminal cleavage/methylation domain-containing protein
MTRQSGFTLVELAIVLMIIGLLIGGILKGQELIQNARITTTINRFKSYDAATITFLDSYNAMAGDITNPGTRLPNCGTAKCNLGGNGDGQVSGYDEPQAFWLHLKAANLVSGIDADTWTTSGYFSETNPKTPLGGIFSFGSSNTSTPSATWPEGLGGRIWGVSGMNSGGWTVPLLPQSIILRVDTKMDNGLPRTGTVMSGLGTGCYDTVYDISNPVLCGFYARGSF